VNVIVGRRDVLKTLALTAATSAIGLASARLGVGVVAVANQQSYPGYVAIRAIYLMRSSGQFHAVLRPCEAPHTRQSPRMPLRPI
jgi:hypothetical protein